MTGDAARHHALPRTSPRTQGFFVTFDSFGFDQRISAGIKQAGYTTPTPIQTKAMPDVLAGRDVLGLAQTGTGKTAAFALPLLQRMMTAEAAPRGPVRVLVLAPTRELALQIHETFVELGRQTGIRSAAVFGGVGLVPQIKALRQATVCVACPGRLLDLLNQGQADLSRVDTLVLDEADRMLDMGFLPDMKKIMAKLPRERQNLLFSATMPQEIRGLSAELLRDPVVVQVANTAPASGISHALYPVPSHQKADFLEALLRATEHESVLVFTRTKHRAKSLAQRLTRQGFSATSLQGNLSQSRRQEALDGFRCGKYTVMVATDIAARGIDCARISHVVNYDLPDTAETYTHRIGRTGRAERTGEAMTLVTDEDLKDVRAIEHTLRATLERRTLEGFPYGQEKPAEAVRDARDRDDFGRKPQARGFGRGNGRGNGQGSGRSNGQGAKPQAKSHGGGKPAPAKAASGNGGSAGKPASGRIFMDEPSFRNERSGEGRGSGNRGRRPAGAGVR